MKKRPPLTDAEGEVREISEDDMKHFKPAAEVLPAAFLKQFAPRGPQRTQKKVLTSIRLSKSVIEAFRATGTGWQTRFDQALQEWVKTHKLS